MDEARYAQRRHLDDQFERLVAALRRSGLSEPEAIREVAEFAMGVCHEGVCALWDVHREESVKGHYFGSIFKSLKRTWWRIGLTQDACRAIGLVEHRYGQLFQKQMDILYPRDKT